MNVKRYIHRHMPKNSRLARAYMKFTPFHAKHPKNMTLPLRRPSNASRRLALACMIASLFGSTMLSEIDFACLQAITSRMKVSQQSAITDSVNALVGGLNVEESAVDEQDADACANCRRYNAAHLAHVLL